MKCPKCQIERDTAFCPQCGIKLDPLKVLLAYCRHRAFEYEKQQRNAQRSPADPAKEKRAADLYEKWQAYVDRLTKAIAALDAAERNGAK